MIRIFHQRFEAFDAQTRRQLLHATFPDGYMRQFAVAFPHAPVLAVFGRKHLLGWAFILPHTNSTPPYVSMFVNVRYRKRGVGTLLVIETLKRQPRISLGSWSKETKHLFKRLRDTYPKQISVFDWYDKTHLYREMIEEALSQDHKK